jgi:hypothetical protein
MKSQRVAVASEAGPRRADREEWDSTCVESPSAESIISNKTKRR